MPSGFLSNQRSCAYPVLSVNEVASELPLCALVPSEGWIRQEIRSGERSRGRAGTSSWCGVLCDSTVTAVRNNIDNHTVQTAQTRWPFHEAQSVFRNRAGFFLLRPNSEAI